MLLPKELIELAEPLPEIVKRAEPFRSFPAIMVRDDCHELLSIVVVSCFETE